MTARALLLPAGGSLPEDVWRSRHRGILILLWAHVPALLLFALARGRTLPHAVVDVVFIAGLAFVARRTRGRRRMSTVFASLGLMLCSATLVHLSGGVIEAHFHFFVMVGVVVLYQDWWPFLIAITFVVLHHGVVGVLSPHDVFNNPSAWEHPWVWAGIHGVGIMAMSAAGIANWKLNERSQSQLASLAAIVASSDDAIYSWTLDGRISSWNQGAARLYGYSPEEMVGWPFTTLMPAELAADGAEPLDMVRRGQGVGHIDCECVRKDGSTVEVSVTVSAVRGPDGAVVGGATSARDITERRLSEVALQQTLSLLEATLESTANGILVVDPQRRISSYNAKFAEMWRVPADVLASRDSLVVLACVLDQLEDPAGFTASVEDLHAHPDLESHDTLRFKDGREFEQFSKPQRVAGAVVGRVWSFYDLTERKRLEAELAEARDRALDSSRLKSEFLATMSHEIRTPMNGVIGLTGLLLDTELSETQHQYADGVRSSGEALLGIINDILDFSKIEAGKLELEAVDFDLTQALDDVAGLVAGAARAKSLELVAYCETDLPAVLRGDVGRLRQILLNLLTNAVKFTAAGEVVLRASVREPSVAGRVWVRLEVSDTGIGIAPTVAERLFEPFSQADASTTRQYGGTGLGLAISRRLTEAMGGSIGVDSEPGLGATFWVDLPFDVVTADAAASELEISPIKGLRVLVVEDNATNRLVLTSQLLAWDIVADVAPDGLSALAQLRSAAAASRPYDLLVSDLAMPGMNGLALARAVKGDAALAAIPMILLSSVMVDAQQAAAAGFSVRLTKPARRSMLYEAIVRAVTPPAAEGRVADASVLVAAAASKGRLLVVEDNAINQAVARGLIAKLGYRCDVAGNGVEALDAIARQGYDAVLMDCQMPEMDGFEATAEIRRREGGADRLPIIAMTAGAMVEDRDRCLAAGMDDFLTKPVRGTALEEVLARWHIGEVGRPAGAAEPARSA